jgi:hypothetical protein
MISRSKRLRVLFIPIECCRWAVARGVPYSTYFGFEEGFAAAGIEFLTIPAIWCGLQHQIQEWFCRARKICAGKHFDQVWFEVIHTNYANEHLEWIATLAPVRVAISMESLTYNAKDIARDPEFAGRKQKIEQRLRFATHLTTVDETDVDDINARHITKAMWSPAAVPERYITDSKWSGAKHPAVFVGTIYGDRAALVERPALCGDLVTVASAENRTFYPLLFDALHKSFDAISRIKTNGSLENSWYLASLRFIRRRCFEYYLRTLQSGYAVVNLPHPVRSYSYRVVEAMAAGRPVISWKIPDRPRNESMFVNGREILLFDEDNPEELSNCIRRIAQDSELRKSLTQNATRKMRALHTVEKRTRQILHWVETGESPNHTEVG